MKTGTVLYDLKMTNRQYVTAFVKAATGHCAGASLYYFGAPLVTWEPWGTSHPLVKLFVFLVCLIIVPAPLTRDFRIEALRRSRAKGAANE